jgi:hypothetical protein
LVFFHRVFPPERTYKDAAIFARIRVLDWVSYDHLEILPRNKVDDMWSLASQSKRKKIPDNLFIFKNLIKSK